MQALLTAAGDRESGLHLALEKSQLDVDRLADQLKFSTDDKQNLLAEKKKQVSDSGTAFSVFACC